MITHFEFNSAWRCVATAWHWFLSLIQSIIAASWSKTTTTAECSVRREGDSFPTNIRFIRSGVQMLFRWNGLRYVWMRISNESHFHAKWNKADTPSETISAHVRTTETHLRWHRKHIAIIIHFIQSFGPFGLISSARRTHTHGAFAAREASESQNVN